MGNEDINITIGAKSNVGPGVAEAARDIRNRTRREFQGKGFKEIVSRALQGDFAGALDELKEKMGARAESTGASIGVKLVAGLSAAIAGWQAGKRLDEQFNVSGKIGDWWANKFGTAPGEGVDKELIAKGDAAKAARLEKQTQAEGRTAAMASIAEATKRAQESEVDAIEATNDALRDQVDALKEVEDQHKSVADQFRAYHDAGFGKSAGPVARLMGLGGGDQTQQAEEALRRSIDRGYDADARRQEHQAERLQRRQNNRLAMAEAQLNRATGRKKGLAGFETLEELQAAMGKTNMPRWQRLALEAAKKDEIAKGNLANVAANEQAARDATIKSKGILEQIKVNTDAMKALKQALELGGAAGEG